MTESPRRVRVTHPRVQAARRAAGRQAARDIDEQTVVGDLLTRSLVRAQLGLALRMVALVAVLLGGLPLLFALSPSARTVDVLGLPLPWLLLGIVVYPALVAVGWSYTRLAERNEHEISDVVDRL